MSNEPEYKTEPDSVQARRREIRRRAHWADVHWQAARLRVRELEFVPEATPEDIAAAQAAEERLYVEYQAAMLAAGKLAPIFTRVSNKPIGTTIVRGIRVPVYRSK